jgi:tRNA modification GTPase
MPIANIQVALLTPPGRGALAVVGVAGSGAVAAVARLFNPRGAVPLAERADGAVVFGRWGDPGRGEELIVVRHSVERLEVHCHGGLAASEAVLASLEQSGAVRQSWQEWLAAGSVSTIEVEAREALALVGGPKAAQILCRQLAGALDAELARIVALDAAGDLAGAAAARDRLRRAARVGLRLVRPWRVVVAGDVNAGKSSLVNALAGHARSIVSAEPGTTRDVLETRIVLDGWEIDLVDTAGLRGDPGDEPAGPTEAAGIARARAAAAEADLVLQVIPVGRPPRSPSDRQAGRMPSETLAPHADGKRDACPTMLVLAKCDLASDDGDGPPDAIRTSAVTGLGIDQLAAAIVRQLVPEEHEEPDLLLGAVPFTQRQVNGIA